MTHAFCHNIAQAAAANSSRDGAGSQARKSVPVVQRKPRRAGCQSSAGCESPAGPCRGVRGSGAAQPLVHGVTIATG